MSAQKLSFEVLFLIFIVARLSFAQAFFEIENYVLIILAQRICIFGKMYIRTVFKANNPHFSAGIEGEKNYSITF